jgi:hypothetical protein
MLPDSAGGRILRFFVTHPSLQVFDNKLLNYINTGLLEMHTDMFMILIAEPYLFTIKVKRRVCLAKVLLFFSVPMLNSINEDFKKKKTVK